MPPIGMRVSAVALWLVCVGATTPTLAAPCANSGNFETWLDGFKRDAAGQGISQRAINAGLGGVTYDPAIISKDRGQGVFRQTFEQFSGRMVNRYRLQKGASLLRQYGATLNRIEQQFGVPGAVVIAIWGLETDFGAVRGNLPVFRSLATLAYDCRRSDFFRGHLLDALRVVDRGDLSPAEMRGAWAGEMGQTQFMASSYYKYAVDFDGDGRRDLIRSAPDVLASTANYLKGYGWQRGAGWNPGEPNFSVLLQWNKSQVYSRTVALFASRLAEGGGAVSGARDR